MAASLSLSLRHRHRGGLFLSTAAEKPCSRQSTCEGPAGAPAVCEVAGAFGAACSLSLGWAFPQLGFRRALVSAYLSTACASAAQGMLTPTGAGVRPWVNARALGHAMLLYLPLYLDT